MADPTVFTVITRYFGEPDVVDRDYTLHPMQAVKAQVVSARARGVRSRLEILITRSERWMMPERRFVVDENSTKIQEVSCEL